MKNKKWDPGRGREEGRREGKPKPQTSLRFGEEGEGE